MPDSLSLDQCRLTDAQTTDYWRDGFLFPLPALSSDLARTARMELKQLEATWLDADLLHPLNTYKRVNAQL